MEISPQITGHVQTFAAGAAGCLSMAKVLQTLQRRSRAKKPASELFPNEEHDQIIRAIHDLRRESMNRYNENQEIRDQLRRIADHLGMAPL